MSFSHQPFFHGRQTHRATTDKGRINYRSLTIKNTEFSKGCHINLRHGQNPFLHVIANIGDRIDDKDTSMKIVLGTMDTIIIWLREEDSLVLCTRKGENTKLRHFLCGEDDISVKERLNNLNGVVQVSLNDLTRPSRQCGFDNHLKMTGPEIAQLFQSYDGLLVIKSPGLYHARDTGLAVKEQRRWAIMGHMKLWNKDGYCTFLVENCDELEPALAERASCPKWMRVNSGEPPYNTLHFEFLEIGGMLVEGGSRWIPTIEVDYEARDKDWQFLEPLRQKCAAERAAAKNGETQVLDDSDPDAFAKLAGGKDRLIEEQGFVKEEPVKARLQSMSAPSGTGILRTETAVNQQVGDTGEDSTNDPMAVFSGVKERTPEENPVQEGVTISKNVQSESTKQTELQAGTVVNQSMEGTQLPAGKTHSSKALEGERGTASEDPIKPDNLEPAKTGRFREILKKAAIRFKPTFKKSSS